MQDLQFKDYQVQYVFNKTTAELETEIVQFWTAHGANLQPGEDQRRSREVFYVARNPEGNIVAICTVFVGDYGQPPAPHFQYRMFIRPEDRGSGLALFMTSNTRKSLEAQHRPGNVPDRLLLITENPMLANPVVRQQLEAAGWVLQGQDPRGCDEWVRDLTAAH